MSISHAQARRAPAAELRRRDALDALSDATHWVITTLRLWGRRMRERDQLARLDDRMLSDIGLTHAEREILANKWFWRE